jgi:hypothetical protein
VTRQALARPGIIMAANLQLYVKNIGTEHRVAAIRGGRGATIP